MKFQEIYESLLSKIKDSPTPELKTLPHPFYNHPSEVKRLSVGEHEVLISNFFGTPEEMNMVSLGYFPKLSDLKKIGIDNESTGQLLGFTTLPYGNFPSSLNIEDHLELNKMLNLFSFREVMQIFKTAMQISLKWYRDNQDKIEFFVTGGFTEPSRIKIYERLTNELVKEFNLKKNVLKYKEFFFIVLTK